MSDAVRGGVEPPIEVRQLDEPMVLMQRAAHGAHAGAQRTEEVQLVLSLIFTVLGVVAAATGVGRQVVIVVGAAWSLLSIVFLTSYASRRSRDAAVLQEQFDTTLFHLDWNDYLVGDKVAHAQAVQYANKVHPGSKAYRRIADGWYDPVHGVAYPYDVLICQDQNLAWDSRLRRRYAAAVTTFGVVWFIGGVVVGVCIKASLVTALLAFVVPSLAGLQIGMSAVRAQRSIADERDRLSGKVAKLLEEGSPGPVSDALRNDLVRACREIQNGIFATRGRAGRVPTLVYTSRRDRDERDLAIVAEAHRRRLARE